MFGGRRLIQVGWSLSADGVQPELQPLLYHLQPEPAEVFYSR